jgi:hypothetical protein
MELSHQLRFSDNLLMQEVGTIEKTQNIHSETFSIQCWFVPWEHRVVVNHLLLQDSKDTLTLLLLLTLMTIPCKPFSDPFSSGTSEQASLNKK